MKTTILGIALLMSGTAIAQTTTDTGTMTDADTSAQTTTSSTTPDTTGQTATDMQSSSDMSASSSTMTDTSTQSNMSSMDMNNQSSMPMATNMAMPGRVVSAGNNNPEKDARGIPVLSAPAIVPVGWNGVTGAAVGGPLVDPTTGDALSEAETDYPPCTASRTDNCVQAYTRR